MKKFLMVAVAVVLLPTVVMALSGPATYQLDVDAGSPDTVTMSAAPGVHVVYVYCLTGELRITAQASGSTVSLVGGGTEANERVDVPAGATVPIYGKFDTLVVTSSSGTSTGFLWQYKE